MPKFIVQDPVIVLAGGTVTTSVASVTINVEADDIDTTAFGGGGWRSRISGLKQASMDVEFHQDMASGAIDSVVWPLLGATAAMKVRPGGTAAIGTSNPEYQFDVLVAQWNPIDSAVGDLATVSVSWPITGVVARATA